MKKKHSSKILLGYASLLFLLIALSSSSSAFANSATVNFALTIPIACSLSIPSGSNLTTTATPSTNTLIGTSTIKSVCNDASGFAIYAVGFGNNTYGNTALTANLSDTTTTIPTNVTASPTSSTNSEWNMTIAPVAGAYAPSISDGTNGAEDFTSPHAIPSSYTKVAYRNTGTDFGTTAIGASFTATFNAYVNPSEPAGTYEGKVKFTLVHPGIADKPSDNQIAVLYNGNGLTFDDGSNAKRVVYGQYCEEQYHYIADTPTIFKTENIGSDGTQNPGESYMQGYDDSLGSINFEDASKVKVVLRYGFGKSTQLDIYGSESSRYIYCDPDTVTNPGCSGTETIILDGGYVSTYFYAYGEIPSGYDYGVYMEIYPIYDEAYEGASYGPAYNQCTFAPVEGAYEETTTWNGSWELEVDGYTRRFYDESEVIAYLEENSEELMDSTITVKAYYPYKIVYNGNQATAGTMQGFQTILTDLEGSTELLAPNFLKTGYGYIGWSENPSATASGNDKIYGPKEAVTYSDLTFDNNKTATLYAIWEPSAGNIQGWTGCNSLNIGDVTALTDTRDGNTYAIAKYGDNRCWMMENLRLDFADANTTITADNTNGPTSTFLTQVQAEVGNSSTDIGNGSTRKCDHYYFANNNQQCVDVLTYDNQSINTSFAPGYESFYTNPHSWLSYGVFYNWYSATAGNGTYSTPDNETVTGDICPSGWHLPTGTYGGDAYNLMASFGQVTTEAQVARTYQVVTNDINTVTVFPYNILIGDTFCYTRCTNGDNTCQHSIQTSSSYRENRAKTLVFRNSNFQNRTLIALATDNTTGALSQLTEEKSKTLPVRCLAN